MQNTYTAGCIALLEIQIIVAMKICDLVFGETSRLLQPHELHVTYEGTINQYYLCSAWDDLLNKGINM